MQFVIFLLSIFSLFTPALIVIKRLRCGLVEGFLLTLILLFYSLFAFQLFNIPIQLTTLFAFISLLSAALFILCPSFAASNKNINKFHSFSKIEWVVLGLVALQVLLLLMRFWSHPAPGPDMDFRWEFLASIILKKGHFSFYPPLTPVDFETYFYVDSNSPLISFCYWFLYASWGDYFPKLASGFVFTQNLIIIWLIYAIAKVIYSSRAGIVAIALFYSSRLAIWSTWMGQETGVTTLSLLATIYFIIRRKKITNLDLVFAGIATAVGMLARQYGGVFLIIGLFSIWQLKLNIKQISYYLFPALLFACPWYIYVWCISGSPFYGTGSSSWLMQNEVYYELSQGLGSKETLYEIFKALFSETHLILILGVIGLHLSNKSRAILLFSIIAVFLTWWKSIGFSYSAIYALRVLSPALAILSISAGGLLNSGSSIVNRQKYLIVIFALIVNTPYSLCFPFKPNLVPLKYWLYMPFHSQPMKREEHKLLDIKETFRGSKILTDSPFPHKVLYEHGITVVPYWNGELDFLFNSSMSWEKIELELQEQNINFLIHYKDSTFRNVLNSKDFYSKIVDKWEKVLDTNSYVVLKKPSKK